MPGTRYTRRYFLRLGLASGVMLAGNALYASVAEPRWLATERVEVRLPRLPAEFDGLTIVQLSDFHYGMYVFDGEVRAAVDAANALRPDLIVLTGDYVIETADDAAPCARLLAALHAPLGMYAILGNHDHWTHAATVTRALEGQGLPVLRNTAVALERAGARLWLAGVDDVWEQYADLESALRQVPPGEATILLAHEPDYADHAAGYPVDLQISGHSHGGQIRLPFRGAPVLPYLGRKYPYGLRYAGQLPVYTNRGIGTIPPGIRWNCRPEVTQFTLRAARAALRTATRLRAPQPGSPG